MNLSERVNSSPDVASLPLKADEVHEFSGMVPITATPAALAGGVAAGAALVGAAAAGAAVGEAID
jgi:hypothetical protein